MHTFKGSKWYKCDFHLHTSASKCFKDKDITLHDFIDKAVEEGLDCIAITDHNSGANIDEVKKIALEKGIVVFPGVEVTCSDAKIHLLILFDTDKDSRYVEDYLLQLGLNREDFGKQTAHIHKEVFDVIDKSNKLGAIVIPAHIDEYNGLSEVSSESKKKIFSETDINAVQIVHEKLLDPQLQIKGNDELLDYFRNYYNNDEITFEQLRIWKGCSNYIKNRGLLTFSDNPSYEDKSKHGIWGIGKKYTWIKMSQKPNLESLRQALLLPELRIQNYYQSKEKPYQLPKIWIKNIKVSNTTLLRKDEEVLMNFSPQMSTIIGGRGSGKSSFIHLLRGAFNRTEDLNNLKNIKEDFSDYYKEEDFAKKDDTYKKGVFNKDSKIIVEIMMNKILYRITAKEIQSHNNQSVSIEKWDSERTEFVDIDNDEYINLFNFDIYSQKQIYEIAKSPNALRERIDSAISNMKEYKNNIEAKEAEYINVSSRIEERRQNLKNRNMHEAELEEVSSQINMYNESGISELLKYRNKFVNEEEKLKVISEDLQKKVSYFENLENELNEIDCDSNIFSDDYKKEIQTLFQELKDNINLCAQNITKAKETFIQSKIKFEDSIYKSKWREAYNNNKDTLATKTIDFDKELSVNVEEFEKLLKEKKNKINVIKELKEVENQIDKDEAMCESIYNEILDIRLNIFEERRNFLNTILENKNVQIEVRHYKDKQWFERKLREIIQKPTEFESSITNLIEKAFDGELLENFREIHEDLKELRNNNIPDGYDGHFRNCIKNSNNEQFARLMLLLPEDEILAKYKTVKNSKFKPISNASAGQKTATILTYILAHGDTPLILDQPEDDLDNRLVYGLIVDRLREAKENRQIIVVTHNANIPVNGDSEYITAMDSESKYLSILCSGSIEDDKICNEICEVMEGGEEAFNLRSKRYNL